MSMQIENLLPRPLDAQGDDSIETILARCYRIARERARQVRLVETRARDERAKNEVSDDDEK